MSKLSNKCRIKAYKRREFYNMENDREQLNQALMKVNDTEITTPKEKLTTISQ